MEPQSDSTAEILAKKTELAELQKKLATLEKELTALEAANVPKVEAEAEEKPKSVVQVSSAHLSELMRKDELTAEEKYELVRSVGEECIQEDELRLLFQKKPEIICYDGFEPSGRMHIAQGIFKALNVNKCTKAGCIFIFWVADWFAMLNEKLGGDLKKIRKCGEYMIEVWKACGMDMTKVRFIWTSEEINSHASEYWTRVMDIARAFNVPRVKRCATIMGRSEENDMPAAQIFYPCMQCADIFHLKADICQLGVDQRKVNMLAREYCDKINRKFKPIILSHHMLMGLKEGQAKMSKSDPESAIFMEDEEAEVRTKIKKAFCPPQIIKDNPCIDYLQYIVFPRLEKFHVPRSDQNGGPVTYESFEAVVEDYKSGSLHPNDLKPALASAINQLIQPVRDHFKNDPKAKQLLAEVKKFKITR